MNLKKNECILARKVHECYFLINIKDNYSDEKCKLYEINEVGYFLWNELDKSKDIDKLVNSLAKEIVEDVDIRIITEDIKDFIDRLVKMKFIEV